jgi:hypothetical protein
METNVSSFSFCLEMVCHHKAASSAQQVNTSHDFKLRRENTD